jgi:hypothetical protein
MDFPKYLAQSTAERDSQLRGIDWEYPLMPLIFAWEGRVGVMVGVGVGEAKNVGEGEGVAVSGDGGNGVQVGLGREVLSCLADVGGISSWITAETTSVPRGGFRK